MILKEDETKILVDGVAQAAQILIPPVLIPLDTKLSSFLIDISDLLPGMVAELLLEASEDGGKTWEFFGSAKYDNTCPPVTDLSVGFELGNSNDKFMLQGKLIITGGQIKTGVVHKLYV